MCDALIGGAAGADTSLLTVAIVAVLSMLALAGAALLVLRSRGTRRAATSSPEPGAEHPAVGLLKERLARGEIDSEEFEHRMLTLLIH